MRVKRIENLDGEPSLDEMLDDPVIQAVMSRDGVARDEIEDLVALLNARFYGEIALVRRAVSIS
jgi:hypothetical protein